ncbi:MAG: hypothetical protein JXA25_05670 [Anaerolineales bacterium]|nr:hypothetical protein [Anaerolineales bacterium]
MTKKFHILLIVLAVPLASACGILQIGVESTAAPTADASVVQALEDENNMQLSSKDESLSEEAGPQQGPITVTAWAGKIISLPDGAEFDDFLLLQPEGVGAVGLVGATPELEDEIAGLRDAEPPKDFVQVWGTLVCEGADYGGCQLTVDRMRYGSIMFDPEPVENWRGFLTTSTFNMGKSFIFILQGDFPMWYSIHSNDEAVLQRLEELAGSQNLVEVSGELITGIPDVNATRIQATELEVLGPAVQDVPTPAADETFDPTADWQVLTNELFGYQIKAPQDAEVNWIGPQGFDPAEVPEGVSLDEYFSMLEEQYGTWLCLEIKYSLGSVLIGAPMDDGGRYATCARTGVGVGELTDKEEWVSVDDGMVQAEGFEFYAGAETLESHNETMTVRLENGMRIQYGAAPRTDATYEDYLMKTREILLQIVSSYQSIP